MSVIEAETQMTGVRPWDAWSKYLLLFLVGFCLTGRSFSYLGIPPAKLFIGDLTLAAFIFLRPRELFDRWFVALTKGGPLAPFSWVLLISIFYGVFETIRGVLAGFSPLIAFQNLVFNVYPLFFFLGLWVGARRPDLLRRLRKGLLKGSVKPRSLPRQRWRRPSKEWRTTQRGPGTRRKC